MYLNENKKYKHKMKNTKINLQEKQINLNSLWIVGFTDGDGCFTASNL